MTEDAFVTNFTAGFCSSRCFFLPPHRLEKAREIEWIDQFHIYVIVRARRVRLVPSSIKFDGAKVTYTVKVGHDFSEKFHDFGFPEDWGIKEFEATDGGGRNFRMVSDKGPTGGDFPMLWMLNGKFPEARIHEVVYIGQAYGADGQRNVIDRLLRHETLQRIVAENAADSPDTDVYVYGFQYQDNNQVFITFDGRDKSLIGDERDRERLMKALDNPIGDKEMTQIVEAGLIRYFQPIYNKKFKEIFPNSEYGFLSDLKHFEYEGFIVEIDTEDLHTRLKSSTFPAGSHHTATYQIKPGFKIKGWLGFMGLLEGTGLHPSSGPMF
ncbi:hypothetical protein LB553_21670 [Mesorhizobium sp. CA8]|uniref:hypothetical protein n=1 Tax=Mesorhizobium sp. CA8 TaxID=2876637 RepID=UPI001CCC6A0D|nr:hypothetical protein [Mesorhizobium sp. CA8]MBZ9763470.1 hypothetical protein [Mesorhizobium sp. CA8]